MSMQDERNRSREKQGRIKEIRGREIRDRKSEIRKKLESRVPNQYRSPA
jgi:hypothetical protein